MKKEKKVSPESFDLLPLVSVVFMPFKDSMLNKQKKNNPRWIF